jgi:hypothetical protein
MARLTYAAGTAVGLAPFVLGLVADRTGPHLAFLLVPVCLAAAATMAWRLRTGAEASTVDMVAPVLPVVEG